MAAYLMPNGRQHYTDNAGLPLIGGKVNAYEAGTNIRKDTYTDSSGAVANTNPVILDVRGEASIHWGDGAYKIVLTDSLDNIIWTEDNLTTAESFGNAAVAALAADLASTALATKNAGQVGLNFALNYAANTIGWGMRVVGNYTNALQYIPVSEWAAILNGSSTTDLTAYLQAGLDAERVLFLPKGKWPVSATIGLQLGDGGGIVGEGKSSTIIWALPGTGASTAELAAYNKGSIIRREFHLGQPNAYVGAWVLQDFGIILNHPIGAVTGSAIQVGVDLRNVTRSHVSRVHVGNYAPVSSFVPKTNPADGYAQQGYCFLTGNVSSGNIDYAGGEIHTIEQCAGWGGYKLLSSDDLTLSPLSSAHAVSVLDCDFQGGHHNLVQESQYTTGCRYYGNIVQNAVRQIGNISSTYMVHFSGYGSTYSGGYIEAGPNADFLFKFDTASRNNTFSLDYYSATGLGSIVDLGIKNTLNYFKNAGLIPGGVDALGPKRITYNRAPLKYSYKGRWDGSAIVVSATDGITLVRNGTPGDYNIVLDTPQLNDDWTISIMIDTNPSSHGGMVSVQSGAQTVGSIRFYTYSQLNDVSTLIDPLMIYITIHQMIV